VKVRKGVAVKERKPDPIIVKVKKAVAAAAADSGGSQRKGVAHAKNPVEYYGVSTPIQLRDALGIRGLVPAAYLPLELNCERCISRLREKSSNMDKYVYLRHIQDTNEHLFYAMLVRYTAELMSIVYTPTVGEACQRFSHTYRGTLRGLYISLQDAGQVRQIMDNWPTSDVTTIVITDGERILGLGDLGVNGMGISIGKLSLYTACAGINPACQMPVHIDVGTNNEANLKDPYYLGLRQHRERGPAYDALVQEFFDAAQDKFGPTVLIQFEDFGNVNAFRLLKNFQHKACTFNDDIQGTASVALAGLFASESLTGKKLSDHTFLFQGAGEAGTGIADMISYAISVESDIDIQEARKKIFLVDSHGLVTKARLTELQHHKLNYAHECVNDDVEPIVCSNLLEALEYVKPSVLIGVSAIPKAFDKNMLHQMAQLNKRPIIFALSNPTSKAECTAQEAYEWTDGMAIFSSGSPFDPVTLSDGRTFSPGQGNNAYIFPGVGLGVLAAGSTKITNYDMFLAAKSLAEQVTDKELKVGSLYPPLENIRSVSAHIASTVAANSYETGVATNFPRPNDMLEYCQSLMYDPFNPNVDD